jgi:hypothetical protein
MKFFIRKNNKSYNNYIAEGKRTVSLLSFQ